MATANKIEPKQLSCNGVDVHYWARPAATQTMQQPTLVFLHNAGTDHSIWEPVAKLLADRYGTVLVDWPGYGERRGHPNGHSLGDYATVLSSLLEQLSLGPVVLVGNCLGSGAALEYCQQKQREEVKALALFNVLVPRTLGIDGRLVLRWSKSKGQYFYQLLQKHIRLPKRLGGLIVRYQLQKPSLVPKPVFQHLKKLNETPENIRNLGGLVGALKESPHLNRIKMDEAGLPPTMVVWGKKNRVLPLSAGRSFVKQFAPMEFHVEDGGHLLMLEKPAICAQRIDSFIGTVSQ